jgi:ribosome-associated protein
VSPGADGREPPSGAPGGGDGGPAAGGPGEAPTLTLAAALKLAGFAATGGQAKRRIQAGEVQVNGRVETRRKARLRPGDEITVGDETFVLELADDDADAANGDDAG